MKTLIQNIVLLTLLGAFSTSASALGLVWGESNWGDSNWGIEEVRESVPPPEGEVPEAVKVRSVTGATTDAKVSAGAYADNGSPAYSDSFTTGDFITIIADIEPDTSDVGKSGELIVVNLTIANGVQTWSFLNTDGNFESWNLKLGTLGPAQIKETLEVSNTITIFEGELQAGKHRMAIGYMADGGALIYTAKAININVSE